MVSLSMVYCIQKMILSIEIILTGKSEKTQSDRGQFMTNSANGCHKVFIFFVCPLIYAFSHCCFREKELQIFISFLACYILAVVIVVKV